MKRRWIVTFAIVFAILLPATPLTGSVAAATTTSVVQGGTHTSDTDFNNAAKTVNLSVSGSGTSASLITPTNVTEIDKTGDNVGSANRSFQLGDYDSVTEGPAIELTGAANTDIDTPSESAISNGGTFSANVAGNTAPTGPSANNEPEVTFTGTSSNPELYNPAVDEGDGGVDFETTIAIGDDNSDNPHHSGVEINPDYTGNITELKINVSYAAGSDYGTVVDVYISGGGADSTYAEGTLVKSNWDPDWSATVQTITLDSKYSVTKGTTYTVEFVTGSSDKDGSYDYLKFAADSSASSTWFSSSFNGFADKYVDLETNITTGTEDPAVDVDGDGTAEASYNGILAPGSSVTREISSLSAADDSWTVETAGGTVDVAANFTEKTVTEDPTAVLNDNSKTYSGSLAAGSTTTLSWADSVLQTNSENTINVTLPSVSADAPAMLVDYHFYTTTKESWASAEYVSANYSLQNTTEATVDLALDNASADFSIQKWTGSSWQTVKTLTDITANGTHTLDFARVAASKVRARVYLDKTGSDNYAEIHSETAFFLAHAATVSNPSPSDGAEVNTEDVTVSATVDDAEFDDPQGDSVNATIYWDGSAVKTVTGITSATTISYTRSGATAGNHTWHVETTDSYGVSQSSATYTLEVHHYAPNASDVDPPDETKLDEESVTFDVNVSDRDFAVGDDSVTATLHIKGPKESSFSAVYSETVSSNTTVATTEALSTGGGHDWYWTLSDSYSGTSDTTTPTRTVYVPDTLYIRPISDPDSVVNNTTVELTFIQNDTIITRSSKDGTVSLTGLPVTGKILIDPQTPGYYNRTAIIRDIYSQQTLYLLNETVTTTEVRFELNDPTGTFDSAKTVLYIQRPINRSGNVTWSTVAGQYFGVAGVTTQLDEGQRYRLKLINEDGDVRILGQYVTEVSETVQLRPEPLGVNFSQTNNSYTWDTRLEGGDTIVWAYSDPTNKTTDITVTIYERDNASHVILSTTIDGPVGNASVTKRLSAAQQNETWMVEWTATRNGESIGGSAAVGTHVREQIPATPGWLKHAIATLLVIMTGGLFSQVNATTGGVVTGVVGGGFWVAGWLPAAAGAAITLGLGIAIAMKTATRT